MRHEFACFRDDRGLAPFGVGHCVIGHWCRLDPRRSLNNAIGRRYRRKLVSPLLLSGLIHSYEELARRGRRKRDTVKF
jgi:hypothetical protein